MGIRDRPTSFRSPWQNGYVERLIGSVRRECTDHLIAFNAAHLRRILAKYATYYNEVRTQSRLGRTRPAYAQSSGSETLSRIRSLAGYTIDTLESRFRKRQ
jgi:transposase InsO family protein